MFLGAMMVVLVLKEQIIKYKKFVSLNI